MVEENSFMLPDDIEDVVLIDGIWQIEQTQ